MMLWSICYFAALAVILLALVAGIALLLRTHSGSKLNFLHVLLAGFFLAGLILSVPPHFALYAKESAGVWKIAVLSVQKAIRVFGADSMYDVVFDTVGSAPAYLADAYVILTLTVQFVAPLLTFGFLLSFFKNLSAYVRCFLSFRRDMYVFSEVNESALLLAADIRENHPKCRLVFCGGTESDSLREQVQVLGAVCFKKELGSVNLAWHSKKSHLYFFTISENEKNNVELALGLIDRYRQRDLTDLYVFCTTVEGEMLLAGVDKGHVRVRRVNQVRSLINRILLEEGTAIFDRAVVCEASGEKQISAVIVGMGTHGTEMLRALSWYCQMDGYRLKITAFDRDPLAEKRFAALCPELISPQYNGVTVPGEAQYTIKIYSGCDVQTSDFTEKIAQLTDATYVFISLGSDEANLRAAVDLRMRFERNGAKPRIHAVLRSNANRDVLEQAHNSAGQHYGIDFVGDLQTSYSERVIIDYEVEKDAHERHKQYCYGDRDKEEDFWRYEYCYRSSMASAIHAQARIICGIPGADKTEDALTDGERRSIETLEHRRWNAYMRSEGYVYSGSPDKSSRNDLGKMHHNLVVYDRLSEEDKRKDSRVAAKKDG